MELSHIKKDQRYPCNKSSHQCQRVTTILRKDEKKWDACTSHRFNRECGQTKTTKAKGTKKASWHWDDIHQQAFDLVKTTIARDVVLAYPDYSGKFEIYAAPVNPKLSQSLLRITDH